MFGPNFVVKVPAIPSRPRNRHKKSKKQFKANNINKHVEPETLVEVNFNEIEQSSYYSLKSLNSSSPVLHVLETYDNYYINFKDVEGLIGNKTKSMTSLPLLEDIRTNLNIPAKKKKCTVSLFQGDIPGVSSCDLQTAIVAQRIRNTQKNIIEYYKSSKSGFSKYNLNKASGKSLAMVGNCSYSLVREQLPFKSKVQNKQNHINWKNQVDINIPKKSNVHGRCNRRTDLVKEDIAQLLFSLKSNKFMKSRIKTNSREVQSNPIDKNDKFTNTSINLFSYQKEQGTQTFEHIIKNNLLCMDWINRNLFKVPINPNSVIVDNEIKDPSEITCRPIAFEQETGWELEALCM